MKNNKNNLEKKLCSLTLSSMMILGTCSSAFAAPLAKLPNISNNSLIIGRNLFELDKVNSSQYNLNTFVEASKTVDNNNRVYYKYNGKWYTGKDIETFNSLKNAKGLDSISNDILMINGKDANDFINKNDFVLDWYPDGNYSHRTDGKDHSVEQFVVYFNKPVKQNKGNFKIIVPNKKAKDPYGADKFGEIEGSVDGTTKIKALKNIEGGMPATLFVVKDKGKDESIPEGYTDRFVIELTEDWTRILNTEKTGINYYDDVVKGLRLVAENFEDENGEKVGQGKIVAKRDINLVKDNQRPYIVANEPIYTQIGENGIQIAGKTRILFNEPIQLITEENVKDLEKLKVKQPYIVGSFSRDKYISYNPITPSQEQLKSKDKGIPVFQAEYRKVDDNGNPVIGKDGKPEVVKGLYGKRGDVFESDEAIDDNGDRIKLRLNQLKHKYDFDKNNKGITRFRDYGTILISPEECLTEGKWQLVVKNITDDAGNKMEDYVSSSIEVTKYFKVKELTQDKVKIKFTKPFTKSPLWGYKVPVVVTDDRGRAYGFTWINNLKEGQIEAEGTFAKPIKNLKGTVYVNTMEYNLDDQVKPTEPEKPSTPEKQAYKDGVYEGEGDGYKSTIKVKVTVKDGKMNKVDIIEQKDTKSFFDKAKGIIGKILNKQSAEVESISGATFSSEGIKAAVKNALEKAKVPGSDNDGKVDDAKEIKINLDWYQDGNYSHDKNAKNGSVEQFVITFDKPIKSDKGTFKIIVPDKTKKDPYGADKLGEIEFKMDGTSRPKPLANIEDGKGVTCFTIKDRGMIDRIVIELTEDWTRILNTEETGIKYYDDRVKGLRLVAEGLEDENGNIVKKATSGRDIKLEKDNQKPYVVTNKLIYNKIGENGFQNAGNTRIVFNEPVQIYTKEMIKELKEANQKLPVVYQGYNPLTPSQEQLKKEPDGLPVFNVYYEKVDENNNAMKDKSGSPIRIEGKYALMGDIFKVGEEGDSKGDKISLKMNELGFNFDFDPKNEGISRFRDFGSYLINPKVCLTEGKWRLVVKGFSDDAGNEMDEYVSEVFDITPYFSITKLTKEGIKIKFTEPFKGDKIYGNRVVIIAEKDGKMNFAWVENLKEGQIEAEGKFNEPFQNFGGTYNINNMRYTVKDASDSEDGKNTDKEDNVQDGKNTDKEKDKKKVTLN